MARNSFTVTDDHDVRCCSPDSAGDDVSRLVVGFDLIERELPVFSGEIRSYIRNTAMIDVVIWRCEPP